MSDMVDSEFEVSDEEIATLNAARTVLKEIYGRADRAGWDLAHESQGDAVSLGRLAEGAERAENSIFQTLNVMSSHRIRRLTQGQVHNRAPVVTLVPDDDSGYSPDDPKHPAFHSTRADIWDSREGK